jgi:hypothetical protein
MKAMFAILFGLGAAPGCESSVTQIEAQHTTVAHVCVATPNTGRPLSQRVPKPKSNRKANG